MPKAPASIAIFVALLGLASALGHNDVDKSMDRNNFGPDSRAKCTDGTPAAYYTQLNNSSDKWILWIEGGGLCQSHSDCVSRTKTGLGSSKYFKDTHTASQLLSPDPTENPDFASWNHVWIPYCSGDVWIGQTTSKINPWTADKDNTFQDLRHLGGSLSLPAALSSDPPRSNSSGPFADEEFFFAGHTILAETVAELSKKYALDKAADVILTGCSAGGIGTFNNADWLAAALPNAKVSGNPQAGYFGLPEMDYNHFSKGEPEADWEKYGFATSDWVFDANPLLGPAFWACMNSTSDPATHQNRSYCAAIPLAYPYIKTPLFVSENTADSYQIFAQGGAPTKPTKEVDAYVLNISAVIKGSLKSQILHGKKSGTDGLFSPACLAHCLKFSGDKAPTVQGLTHQEALGNWYFKRGKAPYMLLDDSEDVKQLLSCTDINDY